MSVDIKIRGVEKLRLMAADLRRAGNVTLSRKLNRAMRAAAKPTVKAVQQSARDISTHGYRKPGSTRPFSGATVSRGTREKIAGAVVVDFRQVAGGDPLVRFRVASSKLPASIKRMPNKFDSPGLFRHPVMGNREVWVSQSGSPWFWPPIRDHIDTFRTEIDKVLDEIRRELEAG